MIRYLEKLDNMPYFSTRDIAAVLGITQESAWVECSRYVRNGFFKRLKRDFYTTSRNLSNLSRETGFRMANFLQVPSYISLLTALEYYEATTQVTRNVFESIALKRTAEFEEAAVSFRYFKISKKWYTGFERKEGIFIATAEKAFLDAAYLYSFGKYRLDWNALDSSKFNQKELERMARPFPSKTRAALEKICKTW